MKLLLTILSAFCASTIALNHETMKETLPVYALVNRADMLNSSKCRKEIVEFREAVDRQILWGLRMLDASGEPGPGFTSGNSLWIGRREQCASLTRKLTLELSPKILRNNSLYRDPKEEYPPFELNYFVARFTHNSTVQYHIGLPDEDLLLLGLCLPDSCAEDEVRIMLDGVLRDRTLLVGQLYFANFKLVEVSDLKNDYQWLLSGKMIVIILILALTIGMVVVGTLYDLLVYQKCLRKKREFLAYENNNTSELKNDIEEKREPDHEQTALSDLRPESTVVQTIMCFSAYTNVKYIFKRERGTESIPAIHGMKFFGMMWIIMVHTVFYSTNSIDNPVLGFYVVTGFVSQVVSNATLSVDTFFFLSGFLLCHVYMKSRKKDVKPSCNFGLNVLQICVLTLKRYMRLTPAYALTMMLVILNFTWHEKVSLFYDSERTHIQCEKYWWRNLLYINNLYNWDDMCLTWSWYISNDMQFFVFGCFLLILSAPYFYLSMGIGVATLIMSIILNAYTAYSLDYIPTLDVQYKTLTTLYEPPWLRIPPYLVGVATSLLLYRWNFKLNLSKKLLTVCWCCAILLNCTILFGLTNKYIPLGLSVFYVAMSRTAWSFGVAWFIIACCTNNAGVVNDFLSLQVWIPLSKLTYCAYLLNPVLILSVSLYSNYVISVDLLTTGAMFIGMLVTTFMCGLVLSLVAEMPLVKLLRLYFSPNRRMK